MKRTRRYRRSARGARGLTEEKLKNRRFRNTERAILVAFFSVQKMLSANELAKMARISRSTLYRHHRTVYEIMPDYREYILKKYKRSVGRLMRRKGIRLKSIYQGMFIFMVVNRKIMGYLLESGEKGVIEEMVVFLKPRVMAVWRAVEEEVFEIYVREVTGVVEMWALGGFDEMMVRIKLDKIMYLTETARERLRPILKN